MTGVQTCALPIVSQSRYAEVMCDRRQLAKRVIDFYKVKGTPDSVSWLANVMFGVNARIDTTKQDFLRLSQADWRRYRGVYLSAADFAASGMSVDELIFTSINGNFICDMFSPMPNALLCNCA